MGPEGVRISETFVLVKCTFLIGGMPYILCRAHWNLYEYWPLHSNTTCVHLILMICTTNY